MDTDIHLVLNWHEVANSRSPLKLHYLQIDDEELVDRRNYHAFTTQEGCFERERNCRNRINTRSLNLIAAPGYLSLKRATVDYHLLQFSQLAVYYMSVFQPS